MNAALAQAMANLYGAISEAAAAVRNDELPTIKAQPPLMSQLLQNLIGNAIKYREKDRPPRVHVSARREERGWLFSPTFADGRHFGAISEFLVPESSGFRGVRPSRRV
jgi:light-regulated signal transduction histidine kinase (bacteriophytochrome)